MGLLAHARCVVAADSGPLHLAAALGTPVVGLYGPTDPARNGPFVPGAVIVHKARPEEISYKRRADYSPAMLRITVEEVLAATDSLSEGSCLSATTNFWIRWRVRVGYPVGIAAFWFARPQMKWLLCGVGIAICGFAPARICRGTSPQAQATGDLGTLRVHAKPVVSGKRASCRWIFRGEPFVDFHAVAGRLPGGFLSRRDSAGAGRTQDALRRRICGIRVAGPCVLAAAFSRNGVDGTIFLAALPAESGIRSGHRTGGGDGDPVDAHAVAWRR